jgi:RNA polymerase sigma factor (sigma-70 family)
VAKILPFPKFPKPPQPPTTPANAKRDALVTAYIEVVAEEARKLLRRMPPSVDVDDLRSAGQLALLQAAESFDESKGDFEQWARFKVRFAMLNSVRRGNWRELTAETLPEEDTHHAPQSHSPEAIYAEGREAPDLVARMLEILTPRERFVIHGIYVQELTQEEIGKRLSNGRSKAQGVCATRVTQIHTTAIQKIRQHQRIQPRYGRRDVLQLEVFSDIFPKAA